MRRKATSSTADQGSVKIGLEIHCQLTELRTKLFCGCSSDYRDSEPNELVCPTCFGIPGTLPVLNEKAVEYALRIAMALNCEVASTTLFYRKNYFYPDLPKNFQISQYDKAGGLPIASNGYVQLQEGARARIRRIQLEEDPGKLTYEGTIEKSAYSLVDYNRAGIALVEIVTEPDFTSAREAKLFLERLRTTIEALGVSDGELEGAMRCDANVSVSGRPRVEVKNISSFKEVEKALNYEILRQGTFSADGDGGDSAPAGGSETRHWDERRSITISLRLKEGEQDYRYFPEPDLPAVFLPGDFIERVRSEMPEVPEARAERYVGRLGLSPQIARELSKEPALSAVFEGLLARSFPARDAPEMANLVAGPFRDIIVKNAERSNSNVGLDALVEVFRMLNGRKITKNEARELLIKMLATGKKAADLVQTPATPSPSLAGGGTESLVSKVLEANSGLLPEAAQNAKVFNFLVGQALRLERGVDPKEVASALRKKLIAAQTSKKG